MGYARQTLYKKTTKTITRRKVSNVNSTKTRRRKRK